MFKFTIPNAKSSDIDGGLREINGAETGVVEKGSVTDHKIFSLDLWKTGRIPIGCAGIVRNSDVRTTHRHRTRARRKIKKSAGAASVLLGKTQINCGPG